MTRLDECEGQVGEIISHLLEQQFKLQAWLDAHTGGTNFTREINNRTMDLLKSLDQELDGFFGYLHDRLDKPGASTK